MRLLTFFRKYWYAIIIAVMMFAFILYARSKDILYLYKNNDSIYTLETEAPETDIAFEGTEYISDKIALKMTIPKDWEYTLKSGCDTFIHKPSASSVQIQILDYYPQINNINSENACVDIQSRGYTFISFERSNISTSYSLIYQSAGLSGISKYIECVFWDRQHVVKIIFLVNESYLERMNQNITGCINSIVWDYEDPFPSGILPVYQLNGDCEYGVPQNWITSDSTDTFYAFDEVSGADMYINILPDQAVTNVNEITKVDYASFSANGRTNFILDNFTQYSNCILASANYLSGNTMVKMQQLYYINGNTHYIITFEYPADYEEQLLPLADSIFHIFRTFQTSQDHTSESADIMKSTNPFDSLATDLESGGVSTSSSQEALPLQDIEDISTRPSSESENKNASDEEVSSFADALTHIIDINYSNAAFISDTWNYLALPEPVYAEASSDTGSSIIIIVQSADGTLFYLDISYNGSLNSIRQDTIDGLIQYEQNENNQFISR